MSSHDWTEVIGAVGLVAIVVVVVTTLASTWRARVLVGREAEYRKLAETALRVQEDTARRLGEIDGRLADVQSRLAAVERVLRDVE